MKRRDLIEIIERLHNAAQDVLTNWSQGDLASAVNGLEAADQAAQEALRWWAEDDPRSKRSREAERRALQRQADHIDGYDRDDLGESPDY